MYNSNKRRNPSITEGIMQSISKLRENHEFEDFKVRIGEQIYFCHSLILASCSEFFAGLLRSDMKEKTEMSVELNNISSPTFQLILNSLYSGCELLTKENVLDVWSAVHQLQIQFLIDHCENFVENTLSIDTLVVYERHAKYLQSKKICNTIFYFKCKYFESFRKTEAMLRLSYQELLQIIKSDKVVVHSEDEVLYSIYDWVSYEDLLSSSAIEDASAIKTLNVLDNFPQNSHSPKTCLEMQKENCIESEQSTSLESKREPTDLVFDQDKDDSAKTTLNVLQTLDSNSPETCLEIENENCHHSEHNESVNSESKKEFTQSFFDKVDQNVRKNNLHQLLKTTRYCLASKSCIIQLYQHKLTQNDTKVKDILFQALAFKSNRDWLGYCPTSSIHRNCSNLWHAGVFCDAVELRAAYFKDYKWFKFDCNPFRPECTLIVNHRVLYAGFRWNQYRIRRTEIKKLTNNGWEQVIELETIYKVFLSNGKYIYCFNNEEIVRFKPNSSPTSVEKFKHDIRRLKYALSFHKTIVVFCSVENNGVEETAAHSWNTKIKTLTKLDHLEFTPENMTSFRDDRDTYILFSNGNLWKLTDTDKIGFVFVAKLWREHFQIRGAVLFKETLFIVAKSSIDHDELCIDNEVEGVFSSIMMTSVSNIASNFINCVIPTNIPLRQT